MSYCFNPNCHEPLNDREAEVCESCGTKLLLKDRYRATRFLDSGGMSRNFLALDGDMPEEKYCVIKQFFPAPQVLDDPEAFEKAIELFQREGAQLDRLGNQSPHIPQLYGYLEQERRFYLIQEFIDGQNLYKELEQQGAYSEAEIRQLLKDLLPILKFIHDRGTIHRDIKPDNIMRRQDGQLVLIDFGMSKHLNSTVLSRGTTGGTMGYAPPEQVQAGVAYPASDIYALGATCIHLLTHITPDRLYDFQKNKWIWRGELGKQNRQVSNQLSEILDRMLMPDVRDRYQSIDSIIFALDSPLAPSIRRTRCYVALLTFLLLLGSGVLAAYIYREPIECKIGRYNQLCPRPLQEPMKIGDVLYYPYLTTTDSAGGSAEFNMAVLSDRYEWKLASADRVTLKGDDNPLPIATIKKQLEKDGIFKIMDNPNQIIALGAASCEGSLPEEEQRALARSETIRSQIVKPLFRVKDYKVLNLGQYRQDRCQKNTQETSFQRSLVIVGIRKETEGLMVKEALHQRLSKTIKNFDLEDYSLGSAQNIQLK
jgi:eukaryotic-like serine/threonine-protein kinase